MNKKRIKYLIYIVISIAIAIIILPERLFVDESPEITQHYDTWKKMNTGTYTYVYELGKGQAYLSFVQNNHVVQYIPRDSDINITAIQTDTDIGRRETRLEQYKSLYIDKSFLTLNDFNGYKRKIRFDKEYSFISKIEFTRTFVKIYILNPKLIYSDDTDPYNEYSYGLLMLPENTRFTPEVTAKIIDKYVQSIRCAQQKEGASSYYNSYVTTVDLGGIKRQVKCAKKYLTWEVNPVTNTESNKDLLNEKIKQAIYNVLNNYLEDGIRALDTENRAIIAGTHWQYINEHLFVKARIMLFKTIY